MNKFKTPFHALVFSAILGVIVFCSMFLVERVITLSGLPAMVTTICIILLLTLAVFAVLIGVFKVQFFKPQHISGDMEETEHDN